MKNKTILTLIVLAIFYSCSFANNKIVPDKLALKTFSAKELKGIGQMIDMVDDVILKHMNETDINRGYHAYFDYLESYISKKKSFPVFIKDSVKFQFFEGIEKEAVEAIWWIGDTKKIVRNKDGKMTDVKGGKSLKLNPLGSYIDYLEQIGKSDSVYNNLYNSFKVSGDISPGVVIWFAAAHQDYDFTIFKNRLWATVFLLRMTDPIDEKIERHLEKQ